jgi:hypothetical protein
MGVSGFQRTMVTGAVIIVAVGAGHLSQEAVVGCQGASAGLREPVAGDASVRKPSTIATMARRVGRSVRSEAAFIYHQPGRER